MSSYKKKITIGLTLSQAIRDKGISITQFAKDIGVTRELITKYLNNSKHPSDKTLKRIADYFDLPVEYFLSSSENHTLIEEVKPNADLPEYNSIAILYFHHCPRCNHLVKIEGNGSYFPKFCEECGLKIIKSQI